MRADNRLSKSLEEAYINNDAQYNFGGWVPPIIFNPSNPNLWDTTTTLWNNTTDLWND